MAGRADDLVIVGAGPAGLALAQQLAKAGVSYRLLDRGLPGQSWSLMPPQSRVLSPWWTNRLPGTRLKLSKALRRVTAEDYAHYLRAYAAQHLLPVEAHTEVTALERDDPGRFELTTSAGKLRPRIIVAATGQYQNPFWPELPMGNDASIPSLHIGHYQGVEAMAEQAAGGSKILVVGRRVTAGQVMVELHDAGYRVSLAAGGPVQTRADWRRHPLKEELYFAYEPALVRLWPGRKATEHPIMDGGRTRQLLSSGAVTVRPALTGVMAGKACFSDGSRDCYDLILYATGYRPALHWLSPLFDDPARASTNLVAFESAIQSGLFFLGLDNLYDFRSSYLRGIAADAQRLAEVIQQRIGMK